MQTGLMGICMRELARDSGFVLFLVCQSYNLFRIHIFIQSYVSDSLRIWLKMEAYSLDSAKAYPVNKNDDWLWKRQGLALPVLPPTTTEAQKFFFTQIRHFADEASLNGKQKINFKTFAQEWNQTADGKERFYVTMEVLSSYVRSWERITNIRASEEMISKQLAKIRESRQIFTAPNISFPAYMVMDAVQIHPTWGVVDHYDMFTTPSLSTDLALSRPPHTGNQAIPDFFNNFQSISSSSEMPEVNSLEGPAMNADILLVMSPDPRTAEVLGLPVPDELLLPRWVLFRPREWVKWLSFFVEVKTWILSIQIYNSQRNGVMLCQTTFANALSASVVVVVVPIAWVTATYSIVQIPAHCHAKFVIVQEIAVV
jgi:hypothetical protein